ncbi:uncharacterized protein [Struthio camelus]|uniref:uncharacterized protein n=1 Tax=Struthio camelus TaxID=8801 RepID=UPI003603E84D
MFPGCGKSGSFLPLLGLAHVRLGAEGGEMRGGSGPTPAAGVPRPADSCRELWHALACLHGGHVAWLRRGGSRRAPQHAGWLPTSLDVLIRQFSLGFTFQETLGSLPMMLRELQFGSTEEVLKIRKQKHASVALSSAREKATHLLFGATSGAHHQATPLGDLAQVHRAPRANGDPDAAVPPLSLSLYALLASAQQTSKETLFYLFVVELRVKHGQEYVLPGCRSERRCNKNTSVTSENSIQGHLNHNSTTHFPPQNVPAVIMPESSPWRKSQ